MKPPPIEKGKEFSDEYVRGYNAAVDEMVAEFFAKGGKRPSKLSKRQQELKEQNDSNQAS